MANKNGHWYTDKNGHHYFVEDGQTPKEGWEASKRRKMIDGGEYKVSEDGNEYKSVSRDEYDKFEADDDFDINSEDDFGFDEEENSVGLQDYHLEEIEKSLAPAADMSASKVTDMISKEVDELMEDGYDLEDAYAIARDNFLDKYNIFENDATNILINMAEEDGHNLSEAEAKNILADWNSDAQKLEDFYKEINWDAEENEDDEDAIWEKYNKGEIDEKTRNELNQKRQENLNKQNNFDRDLNNWQDEVDRQWSTPEKEEKRYYDTADAYGITSEEKRKQVLNSLISDYQESLNHGDKKHADEVKKKIDILNSRRYENKPQEKPSIDNNEIEKRKNETPEESYARMKDQWKKEREALSDRKYTADDVEDVGDDRPAFHYEGDDGKTGNKHIVIDDGPHKGERYDSWDDYRGSKQSQKKPGLDINELNRRTLRSASIGQAVQKARKNGQSPQQVMDAVAYDLDIEPGSEEYETLKSYAMYDTRMNKDTGKYEYNKYSIGSNKLLNKSRIEAMRNNPNLRNIFKNLSDEQLNAVIEEILSYKGK